MITRDAENDKPVTALALEYGYDIALLGPSILTLSGAISAIFQGLVL